MRNTPWIIYFLELMILAFILYKNVPEKYHWVVSAITIVLVMFGFAMNEICHAIKHQEKEPGDI